MLASPIGIVIDHLLRDDVALLDIDAVHAGEAEPDAAARAEREAEQGENG